MAESAAQKAAKEKAEAAKADEVKQSDPKQDADKTTEQQRQAVEGNGVDDTEPVERERGDGEDDTVGAGENPNQDAIGDAFDSLYEAIVDSKEPGVSRELTLRSLATQKDAVRALKDKQS